jgi:hypothetical protein
MVIRLALSTRICVALCVDTGCGEKMRGTGPLLASYRETVPFGKVERSTATSARCCAGAAAVAMTILGQHGKNAAWSKNFNVNPAWFRG